MGKVLAVVTHEAAEILTNSPHIVTLVDTFSEAMRLLQTEHTDLVIADIRVQDAASEYGTVFDFLRWIKGDPLLRNVPFLCLSLDPNLNPTEVDGLRIAARSLGASKFLIVQKCDQAIVWEEIGLLLEGVS